MFPKRRTNESLPKEYEDKRGGINAVRTIAYMGRLQTEIVPEDKPELVFTTTSELIG